MVERSDWLEALLDAQGASFASPAPDLRSGVASAIARPRRRPSTLRRAALVAAAAAALALIAALAITPARTGVAEFFGLIEGYHVEVVEAPATPVPRATRLPAASATASSTATPTPQVTPSPTRIETVAEPATGAEAEAFLGVPLVYLEGREPLAIFVMSHIGGDWVILRYADLDLWQTQGITYFGKAGAPGTLIETPLVNDRGGYWVVGPREIRFSPATDAAPLEVERNSLIWQGAALVYRIETDLPLEDVLVIAEALP